MIVVVDHLGPVRHAEIDLSKKLIVFAGPNYTGKTSVAWVLYGWMRHFLVLNWMVMGPAPIPAHYAEAMHKEFQKIADAFTSKLADYFFVPSVYFENTKIQIKLDSSENFKFVEGSDFAWSMYSHIYSLIPKGAIFPVERTAVSLFAKELAASRVDLVERILANPDHAREIAIRSARRYPSPIMDCIRIANDLVGLGRRLSPFVDLADELENLLGGQVDVSSEGEIGFTRQGGAPRVPFHLSASVVKSLASLVFYFRHQAVMHDSIVIDEPELNLHPNLQRKLAHFFAKVIHRGFQVIMSTHSDYLLREISNLLRLGEAGEQGQEIATTLGIQQESLIHEEELGVWYFHDGEAEALTINGDGFNLPTIEDVIAQQNLDTQTIEFGINK